MEFLKKSSKELAQNIDTVLMWSSLLIMSTDYFYRSGWLCVQAVVVQHKFWEPRELECWSSAVW